MKRYEIIRGINEIRDLKLKIEELQRELGWEYSSSFGSRTWQAPYICVSQQLETICNYLGIFITKEIEHEHINVIKIPPKKTTKKQ